MATIFYDEDGFCQLEILPAQNESHCRGEMESLEGFVDAHGQGDMGYTDMWTRTGIPSPTRWCNLPVADIESAMTAICPRFDAVETGYGSHRELCPRAIAFGHRDNVVLFLEAADDMVQRIWLRLMIHDEADMLHAVELFQSLSQLGDGILADWESRQIVRIGDADAVASYLRS